MHRVGGGLFLAGGLIVVAVLAVSSWPEMDRAILMLTAGVAVLAGTLLLLLGHLRPLPPWTFPLLALLGTCNVTATLLASGPEGAAPFGILYVFVTVYSFHYFRFPMAMFQVVMAAVAHAVVLLHVVVPDAAAQWLVITCGMTVVGVLIGRGGHRIRDLLVAEREATQRLRDLDELRTAFLRAVSHELRTPLTTVIGNTELLRLRGDQLSMSQSRQLLDGIDRNANRLERLLTNLLDIDRIARGVIQPLRAPTDLGALATRVVDELRVSTHRLDVHIEGKVVIDLEASKIERVVENLVANALRHTPTGSTVKVRVVGLRDAVQLSVEDDGPGLRGVDGDDVFEPFVQGVDASNSASPGTGIGLALVRRFTELHDGIVTAGSAAGGGAVFRVRLPRMDDGTVTPALSVGERSTPA